MRKTAILIFVLALTLVLAAPTVWAQDSPGDVEKAEKTKDDTSAQTDEAKMDDTTAAAAEMETAGEEDNQGETVVEEVVDPKAPYLGVTFAEGEKPQIVMETTQGNIVIELWPDKAMKHSQSFMYLTRKGYFDGITFHRVVAGFVIQGGDPEGTGHGGPGYNVPAEFNDVPHEDGILSMARRGDDINSAGSQFFICLGRLSHLDKQYTVFGKVVEGLDVVHKIEKVPVDGSTPITPVVMNKVYEKTE